MNPDDTQIAATDAPRDTWAIDPKVWWGDDLPLLLREATVQCFPPDHSVTERVLRLAAGKGQLAVSTVNGTTYTSKAAVRDMFRPKLAKQYTPPPPPPPSPPDDSVFPPGPAASAPGKGRQKLAAALARSQKLR